MVLRAGRAAASAASAAARLLASQRRGKLLAFPARGAAAEAAAAAAAAAAPAAAAGAGSALAGPSTTAHDHLPRLRVSQEEMDAVMVRPRRAPCGAFALRARVGALGAHS